jgi:hypothetical protein
MGKVTDLESASKKLAEAKHIDPAIIIGQPNNPQHLGSIDVLSRTKWRNAVGKN